MQNVEAGHQVGSVIQSLLATDALIAIVASDYELEAPHQCLLWQAGNTDTYVVRTEQDGYILRLYRTGWRTDGEVAYELDAIHHLANKGVSVAEPVRRRDGEWFRTIEAPEGLRQLILFRYAEGREAYDEEGYSARFGRSMAELHLATDGFHSSHPRFHLDFDFLLHQPLRWIQPLLVHRPTDWQYLLELAAWLRQQVETLSTAGLEWGFCHGDALGGNAHLNGDVLTHFDFDDCGLGWRAYDLATYLWINAWRKPQVATERWEEYLHAYGEQRALAAVNLDAAPVFVAIREFWVIGQQVRAASFRGHWWVKDSYFDRRLEFLREWEQRSLPRR